MQRKIIHVDMDCFYAAIEIRDRPDLANKPVAVGGRPDGRGVLTTCNYIARKYGLHSAMPSAQALKLCPKVVLLPVHMDKYKKASAEIHKIFQRYTQLIEPLSLDEAFLDVSEVDLHQGSATLIAKAIRKDIFSQQKLTASAGIAPNKFLAKVASDWNKPNGQFVITPDEVYDFVSALPVGKIPGVGPVTEKKLKLLHVETCADLQQWSAEKLLQQFGKLGESLYGYARGVDERPVKTKRIRKSLSVERTFEKNLRNEKELLDTLPDLFTELQHRYENIQQKPPGPVKTIFIKLKYYDFRVTTHQIPALKSRQSLYKKLLLEAWGKCQQPVRLVGIGMQFDTASKDTQLKLLEE
ncbi:MAG TPA: DNA polymerase IV [Thiotrichales bacterium]|nr:DNA polymerase IV [Thiotrichales bacterium]